MFDFSQFQALVHASLQLLTEGVHLSLLFLHELGFSCQDLLVAVLEVLDLLSLLHLIGSELYLMGVLIVLLLREGLLDASEVEQFC